MSQTQTADTTSLEYRRFLLNYARERIAAKNYYDADFALQVSQSRYPNDPISYNLHGMLAHRLGLFEHGLHFVNKALEFDPTMTRAQENLSTIERDYFADQARPKIPEEKYFLIHSWGSGLGFDLLYLLQQLLLSELSGRKPVVFWGKNSLYTDDPSKDCFREYFDPISSLGLDDLRLYMPDVYPAHWQKRDLSDYVRRTRWRNTINDQQYKIGGPYFINRPEKVVVGGEFSSVGMLRPWLAMHPRYSRTLVGDIYRDLIRQYIRPKQYLQDRANQFIKKQFSDQPYLAIHLRGTDKHREKQSNAISSINDDLINKLLSMPEEYPIFLMTDDTRQVSLMKTLFGSRLNYFNVSRTDNEMKGVHHLTTNKRKIAEEVIVDMIVASRSTNFFGCGLSYLACMVSYMQSSKNLSTLLPFDVMTRFIDIPMPK